MAIRLGEGHPLWRQGVLAGALAAGLLISLRLPCPLAEAGGERAAGDRVGRLIRITLPITGKTYDQVHRFAAKALRDGELSGTAPVLIFEFDVPPDQTGFARTSQFGAARDLAYYLSEDVADAKATTVAYLPESIRVEGHAVLVVLACDVIVMAPDAEIGAAGINERTITPDVHSAYKEIGNRRKIKVGEIALGLVDRRKKVLEAETDDGPRYVSEQGLEELRKERTILSSRVLFEAEEPGRLSGSEARELDIVDFMASNRQDLARGLELRPEAVQEDLSLSEAWRAVRVDLKGPMNAEGIRQAQNMIADAVRHDGANFVCLWIDSPGGSPADSIELANSLAYDLDPREVRTVAYIPSEALADASMVALACDQVVMHPRARLGGEGDYVFSEEDTRLAREALKRIAEEKSRSWSLWAAMIDADLEVFRCVRLGALEYSEYFSEEELAEQPDPKDWDRRQVVTRPEKPFQVSGVQAVDYWLADHLAKDFYEFKELYGLEEEPGLLDPGWADFLIEALASPGVAVFLLVIGFVALYAELHAPGIGIGGFAAAVCFLLFFWSRFLGGSAGWLEVTLFVAGVSCLLLEVFVLPGFGIFGLGGGLLIITSLILASQTFVWPRNDYQFGRLQNSLLMLGGAAVGSIVATVVLNRWLPNAPLFGQIMLNPPLGEEAESLSRREAMVDFGDLVGSRGTTLTPLVPSGKARFGDRRLDVIADGEFIQRGTEVVVMEVHGNRIMVRDADEVA